MQGRCRGDVIGRHREVHGKGTGYAARRMGDTTEVRGRCGARVRRLRLLLAEVALLLEAAAVRHEDQEQHREEGVVEQPARRDLRVEGPGR